MWLIDGEYDIHKKRKIEDGQEANPGYIFFTNRYNIKDFENKVDEIEFHFKKNKIFVNGFPIKIWGNNGLY